MSATGRLYAYEARIARILSTARALPPESAETTAILASHACVLTSGLIEESIRVVLIDWARVRTAPAVLNYVEAQLGYFQNPKVSKIFELLRSWDPGWAATLQDLLIDEERAAIDSVVSNKNQISHGKNVSLSLVPMERYFKLVVGSLHKVDAVIGS